MQTLHLALCKSDARLSQSVKRVSQAKMFLNEHFPGIVMIVLVLYYT